MELRNEFRVAAPIDEVWTVLTDVERIAPCLPGAELQEVDGDEYRGVVRVKVGPITAQYKGAAHFLGRDDADHRAVLRAEGRETRGQGNASATITAQLQSDGTGTQVEVVTDLMITGRVAQFGRGILADVSTKLLGQFVTNLEQLMLADPPAETNSAAAAGDGARRAPVAFPPSASEPVDLLEAAGAPVAKRFVPAAVAAAVAVLLLRRRRRRRRQRRRARR
jgi:hypothetical protein